MNISYAPAPTDNDKVSCMLQLIKQALREQNIPYDESKLDKTACGIGLMYDLSTNLKASEMLGLWIKPNPTFNANIYDSKARVLAITKTLDIILGNVINGNVYLDYLSPYYYGLKLNFSIDTEILLIKVIN